MRDSFIKDMTIGIAAGLLLLLVARYMPSLLPASTKTAGATL